MLSSGATWREIFSDALHNDMGFKNHLADHHIRLKADEDQHGNKYSTHICIYFYDIMIILHTPDKYMEMIKNELLVKLESIDSCAMYLGMNCKIENDGNWFLGSGHNHKKLYTKDIILLVIYQAGQNWIIVKFVMRYKQSHTNSN